MFACGYFRVSSEDTALDKFAVGKYRNKLLNFGIQEQDIFYDFSSGGNTNREQYQKMVGLIKTGKYDRFLVPMQSRLNRNLLNSELLAEDLARNNAKLTILESGITLDPNLPSDRLLYQINAIFDHQQLSQCRQTNRDNALEMRRRKKLNKVPFGYVLERGKPKIDREPYVCLLESQETLSPVDVLLDLIDTIIELKNYIQAANKIHQKFGVQNCIFKEKYQNKRQVKLYDFSKDNRFKHRKSLYFEPASLKHLIRNPLLVGDLGYFCRDRTKATILQPQAYKELAVISRAKLNLLKSIMTNKDYSKTKKRNYPYTGLIYCGFCSARCYTKRGGKRKGNQRSLYYFCKNQKNGCQARYVRVDAIETAVVEKLTARYQQISNLAISELDSNQESPEILKLLAEIEQLKSLNSNNQFITGLAIKLDYQDLNLL